MVRFGSILRPSSNAAKQYVGLSTILGPCSPCLVRPGNPGHHPASSRPHARLRTTERVRRRGLGLAGVIHDPRPVGRGRARMSITVLFDSRSANRALRRRVRSHRAARPGLRSTSPQRLCPRRPCTFAAQRSCTSRGSVGGPWEGSGRERVRVRPDPLGRDSPGRHESLSETAGSEGARVEVRARWLRL